MYRHLACIVLGMCLTIGIASVASAGDIDASLSGIREPNGASQGDAARSAQSIPPPIFSGDGQVVPKEFFGLHIHRAKTIPWPTVKFHGWRLWDTYTNWLSLEPIKGRFAFSRLDPLVELAEIHHIELILTLGMTPRWASTRPDEHCPYGGGGCAAPPRDMKDWENYVRTVVTRYRGRIAYYEIWNEPTFSEMQPFKNGFFSGTGAEMVALAKSAHSVIKELDPTAKVLSPGFHEEGGVPRLDRFLALGGQPYVDVVSHHFYRSSPETLRSLVESVRNVMSKYGMGSIPLWNTESGYLVQNSKNEVKPWRPEPWSWSSRVLSQDDEAAIIPRSFALGFAAGLDRYYWYAWDAGVMGVAEDEGRRNGPAVLGWLRSTQWLEGARIIGCGSSNKTLWVCEMAREGNRKGWMVWNTTGAIYWRVPDAWGAATYEQLMNPTSISIGASRAVDIGPAPMLFKTDVSPWTN